MKDKKEINKKDTLFFELMNSYGWTLVVIGCMIGFLIHFGYLGFGVDNETTLENNTVNMSIEPIGNTSLSAVFCENDWCFFCTTDNVSMHEQTGLFCMNLTRNYEG